jgi:hypothetical protein
MTSYYSSYEKYKKLKSTMRTKDVFLGLIVLVLTLLTFFWGRPVLSYGFSGWSVLIFFIGIVFFLFDIQDMDELEGSWRLWTGIGLMVFGFLFWAILPIGSAAMFRANDYRGLIGQVEEKTFSNDISPIDPSRMVLIDYEVAAKLGDKRLVSSDMSLGSIATIGKYTHQKIGTDLYYVAPLNHTDFWKWRQNKQGTPGYIIVNAHNQKDVRLVKEVNGKPIHLKYQEGGCFGDYLPRHIYRNGYRNYGQYEYEFELDDNFNPWYVVPLYKKKVGYGGKDVVKVLIVNPETGKIDEYEPKDLPAWVDRAYPKELVNDQFNKWGEWVHGWPNWANKDKMKLSQGTQIIYGSDGRCYLYSGVTSVGEDNASIGFILSDSRTKKTILYKAGGAVESAAQSSAQGRVQQMGYKASWPRPYNINGVWTYVMALKDQEGLIKSIGLVSYLNYEIVGIGDNIMDAIRNYKSALNSRGDIVAPLDDHSKTVLEGVISRLGLDSKEGQYYYYIVLNEKPNTLFVGTSAISNKLPITKVGDKIKISFEAGNEGEVFIETFDNLNLNFIRTPQQTKVDSMASTTQKRIDTETLDTRVKVKLQNMTEEEKLKLLKKDGKN